MIESALLSLMNIHHLGLLFPSVRYNHSYLLIILTSGGKKWKSYDQNKYCKYCKYSALVLLWTVFLSAYPLISSFQLVKACVRYYLLNFIFSPNDSPYEKCFLFDLKGSFRSRDIQIFVIFSLPFHCFQIQKDKWKWNNLWCDQLTCINLQM